MISAWMLYSIAVGALAAGASLVLETLMRSHRLPTRGVWVGGMGLGALWPVWAAFRPETPGPGVLPTGPLTAIPLEPLTLQVTSTSIWQALDTPLVTVWVLATAALVGHGLRLLLRTRRLREKWAPGSAGGLAVLVSEDWGPGVVGFFNPNIVLPRWCQGIDENGLELILDHEAEHLKAGDLRLLILAGVAPVLFPWSLPLWWMWHRLKLAVEGDCDLRVLRKNPRATRAYLELLLEVGRRLPSDRMAAAMLSEPERSLERRIRNMTMPFPKKPLLRGAILTAVGLILVAVACWAPTPTALEDEAELPPVMALPGATEMSDLARGLAGEPTFTPFTIRPDITNRRDIAQAMEASYPPLLREAGVGGTVNVWIFIDEEGITRRTLVNESSGHPALDDAALRVAEVIKFTAAYNEGEPVPVWISLPITFTSSARPESAPARPATPMREGGGETRPVLNPVVPEGMEPTPFTQPPVLLNREEVLRTLESEYPPALRDAGIGGQAMVWFYVDAEGVTQRLMISESSGRQELDDAALRVAAGIQFGPARNGDEPVEVWISLPISFTTR